MTHGTHYTIQAHTVILTPDARAEHFAVTIDDISTAQIRRELVGERSRWSCVACGHAAGRKLQLLAHVLADHFRTLRAAVTDALRGGYLAPVDLLTVTALTQGSAVVHQRIASTLPRFRGPLSTDRLNALANPNPKHSA